MDKSSIFDAYLANDPSMLWDETTMEHKVDSISTEIFNKRLYISTANQEERRFEKNKKRHDHFYDLFQKKSNEVISVKLASFDNENHRSIPLMALYEGLKYLNQDY